MPKTTLLMPAGQAETFKELNTMEQLSVLNHAAQHGLSNPVSSTKEETDKKKEEFRNYVDSKRQAVVQRHYKLMRQNQTYDYVQRMYKKWHKFDHAKMSIAEAFECLEGYVDSSDPDADFPNLEHCIQTAEGIRAAGHPEWFQFIGLIHDMGKIMYMWGRPEDGQQGTADGDQWALGGDTWVSGCRIPDCTVMPHFNELNPDMKHPVYSTENGIYEEGCGFENLIFAYGHDEYMYRFLLHNKVDVPKEGLAMIRYHSCYPWHTGGAYSQFQAPGDEHLKEWVLKFNKYDLYTKSDERPDVKKLWPYYEKLISKFAPGKLDW